MKLKYFPLFILILAVFAGCADEVERPYVPNYLGGADVGDWARYRVAMTGPTGDTHVEKKTVIRKGSTEIKIETLNEKVGMRRRENRALDGDAFAALEKEVEKNVRTLDPGGAAEFAGFECSSETVEAGGTKYDCRKYVFAFTSRLDRGVFRIREEWWLSPEGPLDGKVKWRRVTSTETGGEKSQITETGTLIEAGERPSVPNYLEGVEVGEWARYEFRQILGGETRTDAAIDKVVEKGEGNVIIERRLVAADKTTRVSKGLDTDMYERHLARWKNHLGDVRPVSFKKTDEEIEAGGRKWKATKYEITITGTSAIGESVKRVTVATTWWIASDAPLDGTLALAEVIASGEDRMENIYTLQEWGKE